MDKPGNKFNDLKLAQKLLLGCLYFLIILMVIFSLMAVQNVGKKGYTKCVEKKCYEKGEQFCSKIRELSNCCSGAGGTLSAANNPAPGESPYICLFD
ncbi:MAG: hypothetical protein Q8R47_04145 [Nanoarchaeota archaeon]|nr:hypothetical protein [Nanoarchaeota archaeon]